MGTVLVVEDEAKVAQALRAGLQAKGYTVTVASNGERALAAIRSASPVIGVFFGLYPASKAARLDPIQALQCE